MKKKNIIICGYPKSGTTWGTRLVAQLLDCPAKGYWGFDGEVLASEGHNRKSNFECFQSHSTLKELSNKPSFDTIFRIIYLLRDPRDITISGVHHFYFHFDGLNKLAKINAPIFQRSVGLMKRVSKKLLTKSYKINRMINMLMYGDGSIENCHYRWDYHIKSFQNNSKVLMIRYEDLLENSVECSKRILTHCGITSIEDDLIINAVEAQSFRRKKLEFASKKDKNRYNHLRNGKQGDWRGQLTENQLNKIQTYFESTLKEYNYI